MSNPFDSDEWNAFADRALSDLVPKLQDSAVTISLVPADAKRTDVKFAVELGFSVMMDKPIIAVVKPGTQIPAKMLALADEIVEGDIVGDAQTLADRLSAALLRVQRSVEQGQS